QMCIRDSYCLACWRAYQPPHYSSECLDCRDLSVQECIGRRLLDEALEKPPFQVWPKKRSRRGRRLPVRQPAEVASGTQFNLVLRGPMMTLRLTQYAF
ncbi:MAG: hypothetical protein ACK56F_02655, partial [bacterium]